MPHQGEEIFDRVDENDQAIGRTTRSAVHGDPTQIHRVAHVLVFSAGGELFLQRRSLNKDVQPGKWDTSVGGHVDAGETYGAAASRELAEELGVTGVPLQFLYKYLHRNSYESEYVATFRCIYDTLIKVNPEEIIEGRFWSLEEIERSPSEVFTPNFLDELERYKVHRASHEEQ